VGNAKTVLFWLDVWNGHLLQEKLPRLFSFAKTQKSSVAMFLETPNLIEHFHLPLSEQAYQEFQELQDSVQNIQVNEDGNDQCHYI
jgi:hypothetical protein